MELNELLPPRTLKQFIRESDKFEIDEDGGAGPRRWGFRLAPSQPGQNRNVGAGGAGVSAASPNPFAPLAERGR